MEAVASEHLRLSGVYWGLTCLALMGKLDTMDAEPILAWVLRCQARGGGCGDGSSGQA